MRNERSIKRARVMRKEPTSAEEKLWLMLRSRRYRDAKVRRQHAIGPYVVDFACIAARLVVEADGPSHADAEQVEFDAKRTADLERWGWRVVRISNSEVHAASDGPYDTLDRALKG